MVAVASACMGWHCACSRLQAAASSLLPPVHVSLSFSSPLSLSLSPPLPGLPDLAFGPAFVPGCSCQPVSLCPSAVLVAAHPRPAIAHDRAHPCPCPCSCPCLCACPCPCHRGRGRNRPHPPLMLPWLRGSSLDCLVCWVAAHGAGVGRVPAGEGRHCRSRAAAHVRVRPHLHWHCHRPPRRGLHHHWHHRWQHHWYHHWHRH